jgi:hypothetical protein
MAKLLVRTEIEVDDLSPTLCAQTCEHNTGTDMCALFGERRWGKSSHMWQGYKRPAGCLNGEVKE